MEVLPTPIVYSLVLGHPSREGMIILGQGFVAVLTAGIPFLEVESGNGFALGSWGWFCLD
ncbi:MAG TPA: hypothetical protein VGB71_03540 [Flavisolibacter sp.]